MSEPRLFHQYLESAQEQVGDAASMYLVLSGTSEAEPVRYFYDRDGLTGRPLFRATPYAGWREVMPFLVQVNLQSPFLDWVAETDAEDWGWAAISTASFNQVFDHLQSLIQILMPDQRAVFFRYWDPRFFGPLLSLLETRDRAAMMGPMAVAVMPSGQQLDHPGTDPMVPSKPYPWFQLTAEVELQLTSLCWQQLVDNTLAALHQFPGSPLPRLPAPVARHKVERHLQRLSNGQPLAELSPDSLTSLHQRLLREAARA